jgi:hypothetical protein
MNRCACPYNTYVDQKRVLYDTQGEIVERSLHQQFGDAFNAMQQKQNFPSPWRPTEQHPLPCNSALKTDYISEKVTMIQYPHMK